MAFLFLIFIVCPLFMIICAILGGGNTSGFSSGSHYNGYTSSNSGNNGSNSSWDGYKYSKSDDCFDDDCDCDCY